MRTLQLPEEIQSLVAPRERERVPQGRIEYRTALEIARKVEEPDKQVEVARAFADRPIPRRVGLQVFKEMAKEPTKPVKQVIQEVVDQAPLYLPFSKLHAEAIVQGGKTQTARKSKDPRLQLGSIVRVQITNYADLEVLDVHRKRLADFDEEDALREGGYTLDEFKDVWRQLHGVWIPEENVNVIRFRTVNPPAGEI